MSGHPERIGKYRILGIVGQGAMGTVYRGHDPLIDRVVALKTIRREHLEAGHGDVLERFRNEARAAGRLSHPAIVAVFEFGEDGDTSFIAMEYVEGRELTDHLAHRGRFPLREAMGLVAQLLDGLGYAHRQGVVHRDIKPANLMITGEGKVKITDFGVARLEASELTQVGTMIGTPSYMSPEQFMGMPADARSDVFAAGVMLYELISGQRPFIGEVGALAYKICHEAPQPLSRRIPEIPPVLDTILEMALAKAPEERFQSAGAFREALRQGLAGVLELPGATHDADATVVHTGGLPPRAPSTARSTSRGTATAIENETLRSIERELASSIGPVAGVLVRKAASRSQTLSELYSMIARDLPPGPERDAWLARGTSPPSAEAARATVLSSAGPAGPALSEAQLAELTRVLAGHIGPIARVVLKRASQRARDLDQLREALAAELDDPSARQALLAALRDLR